MSRRSGFQGFIPAAADRLAVELASVARQERLEARYEEAHAAAERARAAAQRSAAALEAARRVPPAPAPTPAAPAAPTRVVAEADWQLLLRAAAPYINHV